MTATRIVVDPEIHGKIGHRPAERTELVDKACGFIRNLVLRPVENGCDHHIVTTFRESKDISSRLDRGRHVQ